MELERQFLELSNKKNIELDDLHGNDNNIKKRF